MRAVITVIGQDKVGIIAGVSGILAEDSVNILDISQTIMQDVFTMIMLVDLATSDKTFEDVNEKLQAFAKSKEVTIHLQHKNIFNAMHRI
ncbi:MAG: ACT domain-containing protein [Eubacteriales bacterium]|nr:ACT domain-containing protein [Eubacteriales bacterium]